MENKPMTVRAPALRRASLYLAIALLAPSTAQAVRIDYELGLSALHSDNIGLSESNRVSDTVLSPQLRFAAEQNGSTLQLSLDGDLQYPIYLDNTFSSELQGELAGRGNWTLLPERIDFEVTNSLSRQSVNALENYTPSNQQQVNLFTAGPTFRARFSDATRGQLDLRYINTYAEESSEFQGNRYSAAGRIERLLRRTDRLSLNLEAMQTDYDEIGALYDYRRYDAYVTYESELASLDITVDAGYSRIEPDNYDRSSSSPLFRGNIGWRIAPRTTLSAGFDYEFSDAAQNLIWRQGQSDLPGPIIDDPTAPGLPINAQTFRQRRLLLGYRYGGERLTVQVNPYYERIRYLDFSIENQDVEGVNVFADYRLSSATTLSIGAVRQKRDFNDISRDDTTTVANLALTRQISRQWSSRVSFQRTERDSSSPNQSYKENSVMLMVAYRR